MATPAMPDVIAFVWRMSVVPDLVARTRVDSPDVVRHGEIQDAVDQQRRGLDGCFLPGLKRPREPEMPTFCGVIWVSGLCRRPE